jgi:hypothetical protein
VAVLTDETGQAQLTVLTQSQGEPPNAQHQLRLQAAASMGATRQIWAVAEKDGRAQKLAVWDESAKGPIPVSKAQWAMIKEAKELWLTDSSTPGEETPGRVLAKGPCVRLAQQAAPGPGQAL